MIKALNYKVDTRNKIMDATFAIASRGGFSRATTKEIARRAKVSEGIIYHYFKSKEDLCFELICEFAQSYRREAALAIAGEKSARARIDKLIDFHFKSFTRKGNIFQILYGKSGDSPVMMDYIVKNAIAPYAVMIEEIVKEGIASGEFKPQDPAITATSLLGMMQVNIIRLHFGQGAGPAENIRKGVKDLFFKGIAKALTIAFLLFSGAASAYCQQTAGEEPAVFSLEETISAALKNNKTIQISEAGIREAQAGIEQARSRFLPKINVVAGFTRNGSVLSTGGAPGKKDPGIYSGYKSDNKTGLSLDQSIYNGGEDSANLQQAKIDLDIRKQKLRARKLDVEFEAKRLYYGLLLAYQTRQIAGSLLEQARSHYLQVRDKLKEGTVSRFDLLQSKVQVSKIQPEVVRAENAVESIANDLKKLLGMKVDAPFRAAGSLGYTPLEVREKEFLQQSYLNKPEMLLKSLGVDMGKWSIERAGSGYRPQIGAQAGYSYHSNDMADMYNSRHNNWNAGFSVTIPIFEGFSTRARVDEAKARYSAALLEKTDLVEQIAVDVRKACLDLAQAEAIINSQKDNIEEAREALRIAEISFDSGEGINLDVLDAQVSLSQIEKNYSEGIYDYLMAEAFLDRSMGRSALKEEGNE